MSINMDTCWTPLCRCRHRCQCMHTRKHTQFTYKPCSKWDTQRVWHSDTEKDCENDRTLDLEWSISHFRLVNEISIKKINWIWTIHLKCGGKKNQQHCEKQQKKIEDILIIVFVFGGDGFILSIPKWCYHSSSLPSLAHFAAAFFLFLKLLLV